MASLFPTFLTRDVLTRILDSELNSDSRRYLIGLAGSPGSGKSTLANILQEECGDEWFLALPMDGFHYPRSYLDTMPDPDEARKRYGNDTAVLGFRSAWMGLYLNSQIFSDTIAFEK